MDCFGWERTRRQSEKLPHLSCVGFRPSSTGTVSFVIRAARRVRPVTRKHVLSTIREAVIPKGPGARVLMSSRDRVTTELRLFTKFTFFVDRRSFAAVQRGSHYVTAVVLYLSCYNCDTLQLTTMLWKFK